MLKRKCGKPPRARERASLPPKEAVLRELAETVGDEDIRSILEAVVDTIYALPRDHEFIEWAEREAARYRVPPEQMPLYTLSLSFAFIDYCYDKIYGGSMEKLLDEKNIVDPECQVIAEIVNLLRGKYEGSGLKLRHVPRLAWRWRRETGRIVKRARKLLEGWCRRPSL